MRAGLSTKGPVASIHGMNRCPRGWFWPTCDYCGAIEKVWLQTASRRDETKTV